MAPSSKVVRVRVVEVEYSPGGTENGMVDTAAAEDEVEAAEAELAKADEAEAAEEAEFAKVDEAEAAEEATEEAEAATDEATDELVESAEATDELADAALVSSETKVEAEASEVSAARLEDDVSLELSATLLEDGKAEAGANVTGPEETGLDTTGLDTTGLDELSKELVGASVAVTRVSRDSAGELAATAGTEVAEVACPTDVGVPVATLKTVRPVT